MIETETAEVLRDKAIAQVTHSNKEWMKEGLEFIETIQPGWKGIAEDLRHTLRASGLQPPTHHNAWGALTRHALRKGLLEPTGAWLKMADSKSHARRTPEYVRAWA